MPPDASIPLLPQPWARGGNHMIIQCSQLFEHQLQCIQNQIFYSVKVTLQERFGMALPWGQGMGTALLL